MIYISTSCIKSKYIFESIKILGENNFNNIELSGGTFFYDKIEEDLLRLKAERKLNYLIHNYFPPPEEPFVLNLASLDSNIYNRTLSFYENSIRFSEKLGISFYGIHAGFFMNPSIKQIGKNFSFKKLFDVNKSIEQFCNGYNNLSTISKKVSIYIENNVFSYENYNVFKENPFMLLCYNDYIKLKDKINFKFLLDIGHLKISSNILGLNFEKELELLLPESDYLHISDNDSLNDINDPIKRSSSMYEILRRLNLKNKTITLEINADINEISESYNLIDELIK